MCEICSIETEVSLMVSLPHSKWFDKAVLFHTCIVTPKPCFKLWSRGGVFKKSPKPFQHFLSEMRDNAIEKCVFNFTVQKNPQMIHVYRVQYVFHFCFIVLWYEPNKTQTSYGPTQTSIVILYSWLYIWFIQQKYTKPKFCLCIAFASNGDVISGDSNGNIYVWGKGR